VHWTTNGSLSQLINVVFRIQRALVLNAFLTVRTQALPFTTQNKQVEGPGTRIDSQDIAHTIQSRALPKEFVADAFRKWTTANSTNRPTQTRVAALAVKRLLNDAYRYARLSYYHSVSARA
jgi:hypothetical protein